MLNESIYEGSTGKLGKELVKVFPDSLHPTHKELDITNKKALCWFMKEKRVDVVIHCAALASVTRSEENKELAWKVNVEGTENRVNVCARANQPYRGD